jgi:hypothetical protein
VLGYNPTEAELEAIRRGEDPRADEGKPAPEGRPAKKRAAEAPALPAEQSVGPATAMVLRWLDVSTLSIEADGKRQTVLIQGVNFATAEAATRALDARMNAHTYGSSVRLIYPLKDAAGNAIYRDAQGNLLARVE